MPAEKIYALVTGAAAGIGFATSERLAQDGFHVTMIDRDRKVGASAERLAAKGLDVTFRQCDVTDEKSVQEIVTSLPFVNAVVNCAGVLRESPMFETPLEDFRREYEVNLIATFIVARCAACRMPSGGKIVNIASRAFLGDTESASYVSSKGAVVSLTRALAMELVGKGISVNAIAPGMIDTEMSRNVTPERFQATLRAQPTGKAGRPEDVAHAISFLASPKTDFITGQVLLVDGGKSLGRLTPGA